MINILKHKETGAYLGNISFQSQRFDDEWGEGWATYTSGLYYMTEDEVKEEFKERIRVNFEKILKLPVGAIIENQSDDFCGPTYHPYDLKKKFNIDDFEVVDMVETIKNL